MPTNQSARREDDLIGLSGRTYGLHLTGELPVEFQAFVHPPDEPATAAESQVRVGYRVISQLPPVDEIWVDESDAPHGLHRLALFRQASGFGLRVDSEGSGIFRFTPGEIEIEWLDHGTGAAHYFFAYALPLWLEFRGMPVLHASAVSFGHRAVGLLGPSGVGKSTLCAGLVETGCGFVADDGLVLLSDREGAWSCVQGPPLLRLWPSALEGRLGVSAADLPRVYRSLEKRLMRCSTPALSPTPAGLELGALYSLVRHPAGADQITILPCSARESLIHLIEHSLAPAPVAALGWSKRRFEQLAQLAVRTPVKYLHYSSASPWPRIGEAIRHDLAR